MNENFPLGIVCPLTANIKNFPGSVLFYPNTLNGLSEASECLTFHVKSVSHDRFVKKIGLVTTDELSLIELNLNKLFKY